MIIHRDEDDLGVARGLYMDFKKKLGDIIDVSIYLVLLYLISLCYILLNILRPKNILAEK